MNTSQKVEFSFKAGALLRSSIRHQLKRAELHGAKWFETKGFLQSDFSVTAPLHIANAISDWLDEVSKEIEAKK